MHASFYPGIEFTVTGIHVVSCQVYCLAFEEELTVPLKYLSLFITPFIVEIKFTLEFIHKIRQTVPMKCILCAALFRMAVLLMRTALLSI